MILYNIIWCEVHGLELKRPTLGQQRPPLPLEPVEMPEILWNQGADKQYKLYIFLEAPC